MQVDKLRRGHLLGILLQVGALRGPGGQAAYHRHMVIDVMLHLPYLLLLLLQQGIVALLHPGGLQLGPQRGVLVHPADHYKQRQVAQHPRHQRRHPIGVKNGRLGLIGVQHQGNKKQNKLRSGDQDIRHDVQAGIAALHIPYQPDDPPAESPDDQLSRRNRGIEIPHAPHIIQKVIVHIVGDQPYRQSLRNCHSQYFNDFFQKEQQKQHGNAAIEYGKQIDELNYKIQCHQRVENVKCIAAGDLPHIADDDQPDIHQQRRAGQVFPVLVFRLVGDKRVDKPHKYKCDQIIDDAIHHVSKEMRCKKLNDRCHASLSSIPFSLTARYGGIYGTAPARQGSSRG